jgi:hypothetical protein
MIFKDFAMVSVDDFYALMILLLLTRSEGLLVNIETNVQYFNDPANPDDDAGNADWQGWDVGGWLSKTGFSAGGTPRQRLIRYPKAMPVKLQGVNAQVSYQASKTLAHQILGQA